MKNEWVWKVSVRSVEREEIRFAPNTDWQVQAQGFRLYFNSARPIDLHAQDRILITVGEGGRPDWAAFIGTAVECGPDSILLYTNPQYESRLMNARRFERMFSPLTSVEGARGVIDRFGLFPLFPPFHYDEITKVRMEAAGQRDARKNLALTIRHTSAGGMEQDVDFY
ncbi:hypothetical protein [Cohnella herbarum]|uniref:Uncharacterized protein n=1 Tax=Cohnella herbarum TaxID=2728023 RepID=A0A7Z2ZM50_9BACL|nr:hypothetical protein [Cohnella herbarum]QJD84996.1 hypothetical protein HH215_18615 [Cohnella herbarum]